jgi:protein-tyrosine phosphatase
LKVHEVTRQSHQQEQSKDLTCEKEILSLRRRPEHYVDIHCHCLPGVDDGPATTSETLALCRGLADDGVTTVMATPHQLGRFSGRNEAADIRERVTALNEQLSASGIGLTVVPGGDVRVDERICRLVETDGVLTLADGGRYILLELPHEIFIDIEPLLVGLSALGVTAIISHPERHPVLVSQPSVLLRWLARSAHIQVTAASLLGDFGVAAQQAAWRFLSSGWVAFVATDAHDLAGRRPRMRAAYHEIQARLGEETARRACIENPRRVLEGTEVPPTARTSTRKRIDGRIPVTF